MTPRPSGKLDKMRAALKASADALNIEYTEDKIGNVCLKKKGSPGFENATGVVIQCHMDMVCTKTDDCKLNFDTDPIEAYIDGEWLKAKNTTLGADDGIGVAAGLALMEHPNLKHGPIEILITVDEETSMGGAIELAKAPFLSNKILINVDSEEDHRICIGCAGGFGKTVTVDMDRVTLPADSFKVHRLNISGLCGGHSGIEIHLGRANAVQLICRILNFLISEKKIAVQLVEMGEGNNAMNSIPPHADCTVAVPKGQSELFEESVRNYWLNFILPEFKDIEPKMHFEPTAVPTFSFTETKVCSVESTQLLVAVMMQLPHGVIRMSPTVEGLVQTSIAFSQMKLSEEATKAECGVFARSMSMNEMLDLNRKIDCMLTLFGDNKKVEISECQSLFPGWDPVTTSPALEHCKNAHLALFKEHADVYAVHAGLECGLIKDKYPKMDCVSIGPHIKGAHSTDEKLEIATVPGFYDWLVETVARIAVKP